MREKSFSFLVEIGSLHKSGDVTHLRKLKYSPGGPRMREKSFSFLVKIGSLRDTSQAMSLT